MKQFRALIVAAGIFVIANMAASAGEPPAGATSAPDFQEIFGLIRSNLPAATEAELNRAAVRGFLNELQHKALLATNSPGSSNAPADASLLTQTNVFDDGFAYLRIGQVESGLAKQVRAACARLKSARKLRGLILDLRFANGHDYSAAADAVDLFLTQEQPLLKWDEITARSTAKTDAMDLPVVVLINGQTVGSAEALAAAFQQAKVGLVVGTATAGRAHLFKEFALKDGHRLKIAVGTVKLGDGVELSGKGLAPDVAVRVRPQDERAYFEDPFKELPSALVQIPPRSLSDPFAGGPAGTNRFPTRRLNESDLIRMQDESVGPESVRPSGAAEDSAPRVVYDPALARAIDFLKGLALVKGRP